MDQPDELAVLRLKHLEALRKALRELKEAWLVAAFSGTSLNEPVTKVLSAFEDYEATL